MFHTHVQEDDFDLGREVKALREGRKDIGAVVTFTGLVRDSFNGDTITAMTLEHYPGMAQKQLRHILNQARARWNLSAGLIIHRHGRLYPGDQIVCVATASAHRNAAFEAGQFLMDWLKTDAPFWKKEDLQGTGAKWVEAQARDDAAKARWNS